MDFLKKTTLAALLLALPLLLAAQITGPTEVCPGGSATYSFDDTSTCDSSYVWSLDPPIGTFVVPPDGTEASIIWMEAGSANLCVEVGDSCLDNSQTYCLPITVEPLPVTNLEFQTCPGECVTFNGQTICTPGTFTFLFTSWQGCDSVVLVNLSFIPILQTDLGVVTIDCTNSVFEVCGQPITQPGTYTETCISSFGCDSIITFTLVIDADVPVVDAGPDMILTCNQSTVTLMANGSSQGPNFTYLWTGPPGISNAFVLNPEVSAPGTYCLNVVDATNGCQATDCVTVLEDINLPLINIAPIAICAGEEVTIPATVVGPFTSVEWVTMDGLILSGENALTPVIASGGTYCLTVVDAASGCEANACVTVVESGPIELEFIIQESGCQPVEVTVEVLDPSQPPYTFLWTSLTGQVVSTSSVLSTAEEGTFTVVVTDINGCQVSESIFVPVDFTGLCAYVAGNAWEELTVDCIPSADDLPLAGWLVEVVGTGTFYGTTGADGSYSIPVDPGSYTVSIFPPNPFWQPCANGIPVAAPNVDDVATANFFLEKLPGCPQLTVDISTGFLRRCFSNNYYYVNYCNEGVEDATDAYVVINFDNFLTLLDASVPFTDLGNNQYQFPIGDVAVGQCGSFWAQVTVSCDAVLGQSHCTEAHIFPDTLCTALDPLWSGASVELSAECTDSLRVTVANTGTAAMSQALEYVVIEDAVMYMPNTALPALGPGESTVLTFPANGATWYIEVGQEPYHPSQSWPVVVVEGCGTNGSGDISIGFVQQFPLGDEDGFTDIDCTPNIGSYDPNDKHGTPVGYGSQHYIEPGTDIEYRIRFQNTGTDTAFNIVIRDTLKSALDVTSVRPGASSHPYEFEVYGEGVLKFKFPNIELPDSNVNEPLSHGFVEFKVAHRPDAPLGTVIENSAAIYFDFNEPIITNTTFHELAVDFIMVNQTHVALDGVGLHVFPNPFEESARLELTGLGTGNPLTFKLLDVTGRVLLSQNFNVPGMTFQGSELPSGLYFFRVEREGELVASGKILRR